MSDRLVCQIASSFFTELQNADPDVATSLPSSALLESLHSHSKTKHENKAAKTFREEGLSCPVDPAWVDIGLQKSHPLLKVSDMLETFAKHDKIHVL